MHVPTTSPLARPCSAPRCPDSPVLPWLGPVGLQPEPALLLPGRPQPLHAEHHLGGKRRFRNAPARPTTCRGGWRRFLGLTLPKKSFLLTRSQSHTSTHSFSPAGSGSSNSKDSFQRG